jgi:energy-coupling factor transporter ATP-binding protein EcfA2
VIRQLTLKNFKGFEDFTVRLRNTSFLAGPNSAGKSTLLASLRAASQMQKIALSRVADISIQDLGSTIPAWGFTPEQARLNVENVRHEFRNEDSSIRVTFSNGSRLKACWPKGDIVPSEGWFYFQGAGDIRLSRPAEVRNHVPSLGFVPLLTPIEQEERVLQDKTVRSNFDTRLSSRHFRNQLHLLSNTAGRDGDTELDDFRRFVAPWIPELDIQGLTPRAGGDGLYLDLFYLEDGSRREKEIYWIGDGMQIWLQLLLQLFRLKDESTIVLDEPDVYLHADLQRRLVRLLASLEAQTVTATHSAEVLAETDPNSILWVSRNREKAVSGAASNQLAQLSAEIGSQFNVRLARALKAKVVLFVEGKDVKVLTNIASNCGARYFANEIGLAVIPLNGFSNWEHVEPFSWFVNRLLDGTTPVFALLDRDYRPMSAVKDVAQRLENAGVQAHVWQRKELESYLLEPSAISRIAGIPEERISEFLAEESADFDHAVSARLLDERLRLEVDAKHHRVTITEEFQKEFSTMWKDPFSRRDHCPAKDLLSRLNQRIADDGGSPVSVHGISKALQMEEVPSEMRDLIAAVERQLS